MNTQRNPLHPLMIAAAAAVIIASMVGTAAIMGWLPTSHKEDKPVAESAPPASPTNATDASPPTATAPNTAPPPANTAPESKQAHTPTHKAKVATSAGSAAGTASSAAPTQSAAATTPPPPPSKPVCADCGKVEGVRTVEIAAKPSGVGVVAGAVVGGLLGNQVGGGSGKTLATVAGAVGGGYAGNEIEKRTRKNVAYEVDVKMDNGERMSFRFETQPTWRAGDAVRVENGTLVAR